LWATSISMISSAAQIRNRFHVQSEFCIYSSVPCSNTWIDFYLIAQQ
jgi:hypothetical protein